MGYLSGLIALTGLASILFSLIDAHLNVFILEHLGLTIGILLVIIGFNGFLATFSKD